jgi:chaperone required for assembly of F1-ATPase
MSNWVPKRFWKSAEVTQVAGGYGVALDGRVVKTPAKADLIVPTRALAQAIADELDAQVEKIDPMTMPFTRTANSAIDKVAHQHADVVAMLAEYGGTDLLCYRALGQEALLERQVAAWDPVLSWAAEMFDAPLNVTQGVIPIEQPEASIASLHAAVARLDSFQIAALHDLVAISGSLVLALAVAHEHIDASAAWAIARIDEEFQIEAWGEDEEAAELAETKREALLHAERFWKICA